MRWNLWTTPRGRLWIRLTVAALFVLDGALLIVRWELARQETHQALALQVQDAERQVRLLRSEVQRARDIRTRLPELEARCDQFYADSFLPASAGYAGLMADLGELAGKAGVVVSGLRFEQKEATVHGMREIAVSGVLEGSSQSLLNFLQGIEQSRHLYVLDNLNLTAGTLAQVKMTLRLHTYFRL